MPLDRLQIPLTDRDALRTARDGGYAPYAQTRGDGVTTLYLQRRRPDDAPEAPAVPEPDAPEADPLADALGARAANALCAAGLADLPAVLAADPADLADVAGIGPATLDSIHALRA